MGKVQTLYGVNNKLSIKDVAYSLACHEEGKPVQFAIVASDRGELLSSLGAALEGIAVENVFPLSYIEGKVAFLFPGQGSQRVNMAADLFVVFPQMRRLLSEHPEYEEILFPHAVFSNEERRSQRAVITDTRKAQPLLGLVDLAMAELLQSFGIEPDMVAGHSYGEIPALCFAKAFDAADLVESSRKRAEAILGVVGEDPGRMAAVRVDGSKIETLLEGEDLVWAVNYNSPKQTVVAGSSEGIERFLEKLKKEDVAYDELNVACAFHSPLLAGADEGFAAVLEGIPFRKAELPVWSNTNAGLYPKTGAGIRKRLADHLVNPVKFTEEVQKMYEDGARVFVEAGPGGTLTGLARAILKDEEVALIQTERGGEEGLTYLLYAMAQYVSTGRSFDVKKLFEGRDAKFIDVDSPEQHKKEGLIWKINGHRALPENGELPAHAGKVFTGPILSANNLNERYAGTDADIMMAYMDNMNALIHNQRDVLVSYWGEPDMIGWESSQTSFYGTEVPSTAVAEESMVVRDVEFAELPSIVSLSTDQIADIILDIVSDKTGYPIDMLGLDMELETDLSIDSIKKMEIIGGLREKISFPKEGNDRDEFIERMVSVKTLRELLAWLEGMGRPMDQPLGGQNPQYQSTDGGQNGLDKSTDSGQNGQDQPTDSDQGGEDQLEDGGQNGSDKSTDSEQEQNFADHGEEEGR
jgi:malonyl CoA-acyl carrier protein transacylase